MPWVKAAGRAVRLPFTATARGIRRLTHAHGAGESGLGKLIELHAVNSAGDMMITVALASTVFFSVPTDEARGRVALYLAVTMAPFALLAPVVGPLLDRIPHGRRAAMAGSMLTRAVLALTMSGAVATGGLELYPAALGVLVASKAYGVVRSAVVPRLLPRRFSLVKANSRVTLAGLLATGIAAPVAALLQSTGPGRSLYAACVVFCLGAVLSFRLPHKVDSAKGEAKARFALTPPGRNGEVAEAPGVVGAGATRVAPDSARATAGGNGTGTGPARRGGAAQRGKRPGLRSVGPSVLRGLEANAALRCLSGFLIFFLAFLLRDQPMSGYSAAVSLGIVAVCAGTGNALGTAVGALLRARGPEKIIVSVLAFVLCMAVLTALTFGLYAVAALAATAGFSQALAKLSLDAMIQRDVPEEVRTSAFARSETALQMAWVVGGAIGISLPLNGTFGMAVGAVVVALGFVTAVRGLLAGGRRGPANPRVV
ncbi:MFS transporter [Streptomyces meridianus]|uniref:MFS transporter n=1 Tax=Streptomyces meridianus TaxID=2938945 RepID=A0ABT0X500_9ACTN|nr:MFS transporter [Streptomyces meridianus]MCM2576859.1 MFS transporter [Streptomyces meridianus]